MAANSIAKSRPSKPAKPHADYPLYAHVSGRWAKKIRQKLYYFGSWADGPDAAVQKYLDKKDDLLAGRTPRAPSDRLTVRDLCNRFLTYKQNMLASGEITSRTFRDYHTACGRLVGYFGKNRIVDDLHPIDFEGLRAELAKGRGPVALSNEIGRIRVVFNFAVDECLTEQPVRSGKTFHKPSRKALRVERARRTREHGKRMFEPDELRRLIDASPPILNAMILLACNCALGQSDCANLPMNAIDLEKGWLDYPRPKTGIERRCPLWAETRAAIRTAIMEGPRAENPEYADLLFLTKYGNKWVRTRISPETLCWLGNPLIFKRRTCPQPSFSMGSTTNGVAIDAIAQEFRKLLRSLGINGQRGFYAIRHTHQTAAEESRDLPAVRHVMGHVDDSMSAAYRERISDERLKAVTDVVHAWLFGDAE